MGKYGKILLLIVLALVSQVVSGAPDAESIYAEGRKLYLAGEYYDAATKFDESFFAAKSAPTDMLFGKIYNANWTLVSRLQATKMPISQC